MVKANLQDLPTHRTEHYRDDCSGTEGLNHPEQSDTGLNPNAISLLKNLVDYIILLAYR